MRSEAPWDGSVVLLGRVELVKRVVKQDAAQYDNVFVHMSEFSDGYLFFGDESARVQRLIKNARRFGLVLPAQGAWTPFFVDGQLEAGAPVDAVRAHNTGILLHYAYAEDHGIRLTLLEGGRQLFILDINPPLVPELDGTETTHQCDRLGIVRSEKLPALQRLLSKPQVSVSAARDTVEEAFTCKLTPWFGCADLTCQSLKELQKRHPRGMFILKARRGKADKEMIPEPNEWCPEPGYPLFMYLPVPNGVVNERMLERHVGYWTTTGDWDNDAQVGFWMHTAYGRALPPSMRFLANRIMNLRMLFPNEYEQRLRQTIRGVLAVADRSFDWEPYLARKKGEQRLG